MGRIEHATKIRATPEEVFMYFAPDRLPLWLTAEAGTRLELEHLSAGELGKGSMVRVSGKAWKHDLSYDARIIEYAPPTRLVWRVLRGAPAATVVWELEAQADGTLVRIIDDYQLPGGLLGRVLDRLLIRRQVGKKDAQTLAMLKQTVEAPSS